MFTSHHSTLNANLLIEQIKQAQSEEDRTDLAINLLPILEAASQEELMDLSAQHLDFLKKEHYELSQNLLDLACEEAHVNVTKWLIENKIIDPTIKIQKDSESDNEEGQPSKDSLFEQALVSGSLDIMKYLLKKIPAVREDLYSKPGLYIALKYFIAEPIRNPSGINKFDIIVKFLVDSGAGICADISDILQVELKPGIYIGAKMPRWLKSIPDDIILTFEQLQKAVIEDSKSFDYKALFRGIKIHLNLIKIKIENLEKIEDPIDSEKHELSENKNLLLELEKTLAFIGPRRILSLKDLTKHSIFKNQAKIPSCDFDKLTTDLIEELKIFSPKLNG